MVIVFCNLSLILIIIGLSFSYPSIIVVFRGHTISFIGGFVHEISHATPVISELYTSMFALKKSENLNLQHIWIENDALMAVRAFNMNTKAPWKLRNRCVASFFGDQGYLISF